MLGMVHQLLGDIDVGTYFGFGNFQIQSGNLIVIVVMLVLFVVALVVPFPGNRRSR